MNIQTAIKPTNAEQALMDAFGQAVGSLPGDAAITTQRSTLLRAIKETGLPTRRRESWHYTDLRSLLRNVPAPGAISVKTIAPIVEGSVVLGLLNGEAVKPANVGGVNVKAFAESLADGSALKGLTLRDDDDFTGRLNGSFVRDGFVLDFPDGFANEKPVEIQSVQGGGQSHSRIPVRFGKSARATVIERHVAQSEATALVSSVSDIMLG
jgi:Fe-S cluster assembly protein SufD